VAKNSRPQLTQKPGDPLYQAFLTQLVTQQQPLRAGGPEQSGKDPAAFHREFLAALQDAVALVQARIRTCPQCGWLFLKTRKQAYCSPHCSQKVRWARFAAKRPARDYRAERESVQRSTAH